MVYMATGSQSVPSMTRKRALEILITLDHSIECQRHRKDALECWCGRNRLIEDCLEGNNSNPATINEAFFIVAHLPHQALCSFQLRGCDCIRWDLLSAINQQMD
jgi:hypothetical protein